ncbi:MAG TPA: ATP-binding protein [Acidobacteriaceae bacterium]|nr:ATP-binding protein [Acidobacteriaceae bacterium]
MTPLLLRKLSIRVRLTLWYSLVFGMALLALGCASLWMVHRAVSELESKELQERVRSVQRFLDARPAGENPAQLREAIKAAYDVSHGDKWLQVIDQHGLWLYRSPHVAAVYPALVLPQNAGRQETYFTYEVDSIHVRALIQPIEVRGIRYTVQTGLTMNKSLAILSDFRAHLLFLVCLSFLVSSLAGYFMSGKALAPIAAITAEAQRINDKNLNSRLPHLDRQDELADLSNTLNQMLGRIEAGYQSVRSFTANAAHELRSPVALQRAAVEVALAFPREPGYYRDTCQRVLDASLEMSRRIDQLLALARADAGVAVLKCEPVNLPDLLEEAAEEWAERFAESGIRFACQANESELWIAGDFVALKGLLHGLLENAWRYTPQGESVVLALTVRDGAAEVSVADTGIGIAPEDQKRIFERFCRFASPLHGEFSGSGLGLALAQWVAGRHHTAITVASALGQGTRFSIVFPHSPGGRTPGGELPSSLASGLAKS